MNGDIIPYLCITFANAWLIAGAVTQGYGWLTYALSAGVWLVVALIVGVALAKARGES